MFLTQRSTCLMSLLGLFLLAANPVRSADDVIVVEKGKQVAFFYELTVDGEAIDSNEGREPMVYIQGSGQILPALETELQGMKVNDKKTIKLDAANAYGAVDPAAIQQVPTEQIPEGARQAGSVLQAEGYPGPIRVVEVKDDVTTVDFNHPLAGKALTFDVTIARIETPTAPVDMDASGAADGEAAAAGEVQTGDAIESAADTEDASNKAAD
jgi:FKBP-type peptidyl-prolyl cis-trans isomerase SlyD